MYVSAIFCICTFVPKKLSLKRSTAHLALFRSWLISTAKSYLPMNLSPPKNYKGRYSLPPCARKILQNGVSKYQRVSCFRMAVHFKRLGFPFDVAVAALKIWAQKNHPKRGKRIILESEIISQASYAYKHSYSGYGCESEAIKPFCDSSCSVLKWLHSNKGKIQDGNELNHRLIQ